MILIGWTLILIGMFFILSGIIGLCRFPNFLTKIHASGIIDACGIPICLLGLACLADNLTNSFKIIFAIFLIIILGPVATHTLAKASLKGNEKNSNNTASVMDKK